MRKRIYVADNRPPVKRLLAVLAERSWDRAWKRIQVILRQLENGDDPRPWFAAVRELVSVGKLKTDEGTYLADLITENAIVPVLDADPILAPIDRALREIEAAYGLAEDEHWLLDESPPEWREQNALWEARFDQIRADWLRTAGFSEEADLLDRSLTEFEGASALGNEEFRSRWSRVEPHDPLSHFLDE